MWPSQASISRLAELTCCAPLCFRRAFQRIHLCKNVHHMIARARATERPHSHKRLHIDEARRCASDETFRAPEDPRVGAQELAQVTLLCLFIRWPFASPLLLEMMTCELRSALIYFWLTPTRSNVAWLGFPARRDLHILHDTAPLNLNIF
jgi:hypothetical protein